MCGTVGWEVWFKKWWPVTTFPAFTQRIFVVGIICLIWIQITNSYVKWHWTIYRKMSFNWRCWFESAFDAAEQFKLRIFYQLWGYLSSFKLKKMKKQQKINSKGNWYLLFFLFFYKNTNRNSGQWKSLSSALVEPQSKKNFSHEPPQISFMFIVALLVW